MSDWKKIARERIAHLHLQGSAESDLSEELAQHLEDRYEELLSGGASQEEAYRRTAAELDERYPVQTEFVRGQRMPSYDAAPGVDTRRGNFVADLWRDILYTGRTMRKSPLFVVFVVLTLSLGIGANTTVFTLINTLILNPLAVPDAASLAAVGRVEAKQTAKSAVMLQLSYADLKDYQAKNEVFSSLAGYTSPRVLTLQAGQNSERLFAELATGNYFATLGIQPALGRFFLPEEDSSSGAHPVAVMNYGTWQTHFGAAHDIIGKTLRLNNVEFTVIGVAPPHFIGVNAIFGPDLWIPASMSEQLLPNEMRDALSLRTKTVFVGVGRLKPGIARSQAQANVTTIASALAHEYPEADQDHGAVVRPLSDAIFNSNSSGSAAVVYGSIVLLVVVGIVLLIACSNVANLLLARSTARQHELAVRVAIGASRARLVRQLLTESICLGLLSGVTGVLMGYAGLRLLWSALPSSANFIAPKLDVTVLLFALVVSLLTGFVFGIVPALRASRMGVAEALKEEGHTVGRGRRRITFANALLTGQVAFSFLLLVTAALFLRSIGRAYDLDPGFQTKHLAIFMTNPGQAGYGRAQTKAFYKEVRERVEATPGIQSVSWSSNLPLWSRTVNGIRVEGQQQRSQSDTITAVLNTVGLKYFETAGVGLDQGRDFTAMDREDSTPVAIINEKMAHDYWPNQSAIGKRLRLPGDKEMRQIIGVARTANYSNLAEPPQMCVYVPLEQNYSDAMVLYTRTTVDPQQIILAVQREVRSLGPQIFANDVRTGRQIIDGGLFQARMGVMLLSVFGLLALGLVSIGLYGIMAYSVNQRKREIGLRMAMGAGRSNVLGLVIKQGMSVVLIGVLLGFGAALMVDSLLSRMLFGISSSDPISVAGAALLLLTVALVACYLPARWASRVDPLVALREG